MAAIKPKPTPPARRSNNRASASLLALTSAALALPGLMASSAHAAIDGGEFGFQYGRYEEGGATKSQFRHKDNSIQADSLDTFGKIDLTDRLTFRAQFIQDSWGGASPITTAPVAAVGFNPNAETGASGFFDITGGVVNFDTQTGQGLATIPGTFQTITTNEVVHVMAEASPETRKQGDFSLNYEWNEATLAVGGGISLERDYESRYFRLNGTWNFNQKLTTLAWGVSYTNSTINAQRFKFRVVSVPVNIEAAPNPNFPDWSARVHDDRSDEAVSFGLTQVLDKNSLFNIGFVYDHNAGYLSHPYKESTFLLPLATPGEAWAFSRYDKRPGERHQFTWKAGYSRYLPELGAALKFNYSFFHDTWGINAHTFGASWGQPLGNGWIVTPDVRYYSQDGADFYSPFFVVGQGQTPLTVNQVLANQSNLPTPDHFSSDHRLSSFGVLSGGITVSKEFTKGVTLAAGFQYYRHSGSLKIGGGGTGAFANYNYYLANALLKVDLEALGSPGGSHREHQHPHGYGGHHAPVPAGVMFGHMMRTPGEFMVGYRYMYNRRAGDVLHGTHVASDRDVVFNGCTGRPCQLVSTYMDMHMHMLNIMYAPTSWLNLMIMPMFMDMNMNMRKLKGAPPLDPDLVGGHIHAVNGQGHFTGGLGDTWVVALVNLFDAPMHHLHMGVGVSAPTGPHDIKAVGMEVNKNSPYFKKPLFLHYGMQLGSGTWDFLPSLTYTGGLDHWYWGGQLSGIVRMESKNSSGYALGDVFNATAWGGYNLFNWLSASVRGIYTAQGAIRGQFNGPVPGSAEVDYPFNYGGNYWDVGFGLNANVTGGALQGNRLSVEWVQPVMDDVNGYQVERVGTLFAKWSYTF